jgi:ferredoxin
MTKRILTEKARSRAREVLSRLVLETGGDRCLSCGACVAGCPVADRSDERLDPRRLVRLIQNGLGDQVVEMGLDLAVHRMRQVQLYLSCRRRSVEPDRPGAGPGSARPFPRPDPEDCGSASYHLK